MVWQNIKGLELDKKLREVEKKHLSLHHIYQTKLLEYETARLPDHIEKVAKDKLNMIGTTRRDFIQLGINQKEKVIEKFLNKREQAINYD